MGKVVQNSLIKKSIVTAALIALLPTAAWADKTDDIVNRGLSRMKSGASAQKRIDDISEKTDKVIAKRNQEAKVVDGLKIYNDRMRRTLAAQDEAMGKLERSIEDASLIERQIVPLMMRMIVGLDQFVAADMPFKKKERLARIERIKSYLTNANISASERFRQVLEAYSTENAYGASIDVYPETLNLDGGELTVNILQVGRSGLYYQTFDGANSGYWDKGSTSWQQLDSSHNENIASAIRIALGKESRGLMTLPLAAPKEFL